MAHFRVFLIDVPYPVGLSALITTAGQDGPDVGYAEFFILFPERDCFLMHKRIRIGITDNFGTKLEISDRDLHDLALHEARHRLNAYLFETFGKEDRYIHLQRSVRIAEDNRNELVAIRMRGACNEALGNILGITKSKELREFLEILEDWAGPIE